MKIHDGTFPLIAVNQKILPTPKGDAVQWLLFDFFLAVYSLSYHVANLHTSYFNYMLQWHFIVVISLIFISYKQFAHSSYHIAGYFVGG